MISSLLHSDVEGRPVDLQFRAPPPGGADCALVPRSTCAQNWGDAGLSQQEPESSCVQEAGAVELHPAGPLVVGKSPGQDGGVSFHVDQRESCAAGVAAVGVCAVFHKYTDAAEGIVEGGPYTEPCKSYRK